MYAIIETGGKQYKVEEGAVLYIDESRLHPGKDIADTSPINAARLILGRVFFHANIG